MASKWWWWPMALEKSSPSPARIWPSYLVLCGFFNSFSRLPCSYSTMQHIHQVSQYLLSNLNYRYSSSLEYSHHSNCSTFITHFIIDANFFLGLYSGQTVQILRGKTTGALFFCWYWTKSESTQDGDSDFPMEPLIVTGSRTNEVQMNCWCLNGWQV